MGYTGDIMHAIVEKELKRNYPGSDGWVVRPDSEKTGSDEVFTLSRRRGGNNETAFVGVTFKKILDPALLGVLQLDFSSPDATKTARYCALIAPQGIDERSVPETIRLIYMQSFKYEDENLVWLKHPTQKPSVRSPSPAAG
jgi:hypothetical protein